MDEISQLRLQYGDLQQNYVDLHAKVNADYAVFSASIQDLQSKVPLLSKSCLVKENDDGFTSPSSVYGRAYGDYLAKRYELAHSGFESFVNKYPNDVRVAEARTCMSECLKMFDKDGS
jgi:TolA-binding protein